MAVNWIHLYSKVSPPLWYRIDTPRGPRYILMVDMDGTLVSLPYFSWAMYTGQTPENLSDTVSFQLKDGKLSCSDLSVRWQVRMLRPVADHVESHKVVSWLPLKKTAEAQMAALSSNVRRKIRKAEKNGVSIEVGGAELSKVFFGIYARNMHRLGAPAMSQAFYRRVVESFGEEGRILIASYQGQAVGGAVWLRNGDKAEACWFATLDKFNGLYTSYLLWWHCIKLSCDNACSVFSFGRSTRGSGTHQYKSQWGSRNATLYWSYSHPMEISRIKLGPVQFKMPGRRMLAAVWKASPGFVVRWLGPRVAGKFY